MIWHWGTVYHKSFWISSDKKQNNQAPLTYEESHHNTSSYDDLLKEIFYEKKQNNQNTLKAEAPQQFTSQQLNYSLFPYYAPEVVVVMVIFLQSISATSEDTIILPYSGILI